MSTRNRSCVGCGTRLASDNRTEQCGPCSRRRAVTAPQKPAGFWNSDALQEALRSRHFGHVVYAYRYAHRPPLTQAKIGRWLDLTQAQISRLERADEAPHDLNKLEFWALALRIPQRHLWFRIGDRAPEVSSETRDGDDVQRRQLFRTAGLGAVASGFGWFGASTATAQARLVGVADIQAIRDTTRTFRRLDNRYGGGHARTVVGNYLSAEVVPMLRDARATDAGRAELYAAVAELNQLAGWMAYDVGDADAGGRHLRQSLRLCQDIDNDGLAAEMLAGMSHQAAFFRSGAIAVDLADAAKVSATRSGIAALVSESAVMAAHGHALGGHARACLDALSEAERAMSTAAGQDIPEWLSYYDEAYLAAKFAHCFRDLGRPVDAEHYARRSLEMTDGYDRGRLFNLSLLASALADQGRVDEACDSASSALDAAGSIRSVRTVAYLADSARRLQRYRSTDIVRDLLNRMRSAGVPVTA